MNYSAIMFYLLLQMASDKSGFRCGPRQYSSTEWWWRKDPDTQ